MARTRRSTCNYGSDHHPSIRGTKGMSHGSCRCTGLITSCPSHVVPGVQDRGDEGFRCLFSVSCVSVASTSHYHYFVSRTINASLSNTGTRTCRAKTSPNGSTLIGRVEAHGDDYHIKGRASRIKHQSLNDVVCPYIRVNQIVQGAYERP